MSCEGKSERNFVNQAKQKMQVCDGTEGTFKWSALGQSDKLKN